MNESQSKESLEKKVKRTRLLLTLSVILSIFCIIALLSTNMVFAEHYTLYIIAIANFFQGYAFYNSYEKQKKELESFDKL